MNKRNFIVLYIVITAFLFISQPVGAEIDAQTVQVVDSVIQDIFADLIKASRRYDELGSIGQDHLIRNDLGILEIQLPQKNGLDSGGSLSMQIGVKVLPFDQNPIVSEDYLTYIFPYPFLEIKIVGYQFNNGKARQYPLAKTIQKYSLRVLDHQQNYMPFRMRIIPDQYQFEVGEKVGFTVRLENHATVNLSVRKISEKSLYLNIDGAEWGEAKAVEDSDYRRGRVILSPGESIEKHFEVGPYERKGEIRIYGAYNITFEEVRPSALANVRIMPAGDS